MAALAGMAAGCTGGGNGTPRGVGAPAIAAVETPLSDAEVQTVVTQAVAEAQRVGSRIAVAVVTREGGIRCVFRMAGTPLGTPFPGTAGQALAGDVGSNTAIGKARTGAFFSSTGEAFSSRTAGFIIQPNFPPGILNTPSGPLVGVQNSSLSGSDVLANLLPVTNRITPNAISGDPGGLPLFKDGYDVGGVGVSGDVPSADESIALAAQRGFVPSPLIQADQVFVEGIRLQYVQASTPPPIALPAFSALGTAAISGTFDVAVTAVAPNGFAPLTLGAVAGSTPYPINDPDAASPTADPDRLLPADVTQMLGQAAAKAVSIRGQIRRPVGTPAAVYIAVVDTLGRILGVFRTPDATMFSFDVAVQKARTATFFSSNAISTDPEPLVAGFKAMLGVPNTQAIAVTTRGMGFLAQPLYPPGIANTRPGPLNGIQSKLGNRPFGNSVTIFAGGIPLYKAGKLAGGIGVSGDGIDQDDIIADAGSQGFFPPLGVTKCDQLFFDGARLPYVKFPRNPEGGVN